jgi:hypothetical protein
MDGRQRARASTSTGRARLSTWFAGTPSGVTMAKYGKAAAQRVESALKRRKKGTLKSGSGQTVRSRTQAIAIGLSEAREKGGKVPARKSTTKSAAKKKR